MFELFDLLFLMAFFFSLFSTFSYSFLSSFFSPLHLSACLSFFLGDGYFVSFRKITIFFFVSFPWAFFLIFCLWWRDVCQTIAIIVKNLWTMIAKTDFTVESKNSAEWCCMRQQVCFQNKSEKTRKKCNYMETSESVLGESRTTKSTTQKSLWKGLMKCDSSWALMRLLPPQLIGFSNRNPDNRPNSGGPLSARNKWPTLVHNLWGTPKGIGGGGKQITEILIWNRVCPLLARTERTGLQSCTVLHVERLKVLVARASRPAW